MANNDLNWAKIFVAGGVMSVSLVEGFSWLVMKTTTQRRQLTHARLI